MTQFERNLNIIFSLLVNTVRDPGFGFRVYRLKEENQARIFHQAGVNSQCSPKVNIPPTKGLFVAAAQHPETGQLVLAFMQFPKGGGESISHSTLAYAFEEIKKAAIHISGYLHRGEIPVADNEYSETT